MYNIGVFSLIIIIIVFFSEWGSDDNTIFYTTRDELGRCNKLWKHSLGKDMSNDILMYEEKDDRYLVLNSSS